MFIDPDRHQIEATKKIGVKIIELHTGNYADSKTESGQRRELAILTDAAACGLGLGFTVNAGHGLNYQNVVPIAKIPGIYELKIGHSIIARAIIVGLTRAVKEMKALTV